MKFDPTILQPGDSILYRPSNLVGVIIAVKTWSWTSHIEGYVGNGRAIGARIEGVDEYPVRNDKYASRILRPVAPFDLAAAMEWFNSEAKGDKYSVTGLFSFFAPKFGSAGDHFNYRAEFCSQLVDMWYIHGGFHPFSESWPAKKTAPAQFLQTPLMRTVWQSS